MAATLSGQPLIQLQDHEARMLGNAVWSLSVHYGVVMSGPAGLWVRLLAACGMVYGPKLFILRMQAAQNKPQRPVMDVRPSPAGAQPQPPMNFAGAA